MTVINQSRNAKSYTPAKDVGAARTLDGIVIHHWGIDGQSHDGVVRFFESGPGTSAHFVASGAGGIHCIVSPLDVAWHAGHWPTNLRTIGIELRPEASEQDYAVAAELIDWLRKTYRRPLPLTPHRQHQATACPGRWDLAKLERLVAARNARPKPPAKPAPKPAPRPAVRPASSRPANPPRLIRVEAGDTLGAIAIQFRTTVPHLVRMNGLKNANVIFPGQILRY